MDSVGAVDAHEKSAAEGRTAVGRASTNVVPRALPTVGSMPSLRIVRQDQLPHALDHDRGFGHAQREVLLGK